MTHSVFFCMNIYIFQSIPVNNVLVIPSERLEQQPANTFSDIMKFLNIDSALHYYTTYPSLGSIAHQDSENKSPSLISSLTTVLNKNTSNQSNNDVSSTVRAFDLAQLLNVTEEQTKTFVSKAFPSKCGTHICTCLNIVLLSL